MIIMIDIKDKYKVYLSYFVNGLFIWMDLKGSKMVVICYLFICYYVVSVEMIWWLIVLVNLI